MPKKRGGKRKVGGLLSKRELAFVAAWKGNDTEAAREAGYAFPEKNAAKLMAKQEVRRAVEEKQKHVIATAGKILGRKIAKVDITGGILNAIETLKSAVNKLTAKKNIRGGDVTVLARSVDTLTKSYMSIAEIEGHLISRHLNLPKDFEERTEEEKEYFATHGYWPNDMDTGQSGSIGAPAPGQITGKPQ